MRFRPLGIALAAATSSCIPSIKSVFVDLSYPDKPTASAPRDVVASVDAVVLPTLLGGYERPRDVGLCLAELAEGPDNAGALSKYGECMAKGGTRTTCLPALPWIKPTTGPGGATTAFSLQFACKPSLGDADRLALALGLDDAAVAFTNYVLAAFGPSSIRSAPPADVMKALGPSLAHAASLLKADPTTHDTSLPALSLSGGAANGAFVAGFMYAMLWVREQARAFGNASQCAVIDRERFGSSFGSSVGSLISLPLDLYFTDAAPTPSLGPALDACIKEGSGKVAARNDRPFQDCGLALLEHDFVASESDLLCASPGSALELIKPDAKSIIRFEPLEHGRIEPFVRTFGPVTRENAFVRTIVAADLAQGILAGVDERACRLPGIDPVACEREAILASVSEPILAPPRPVIYSGLRVPGGEPGFWLDGGIQSVNPAARAVTFTTGKVLAVNTFRALGTPVTGIEGLAPVALGTVVTIGTRLIGWETSYAGLEQHRRHAHACELGRLVGIGALCPGGPPNLVGPSAAPPELLSVSVPDDIAPRELFASGYTFDPIVMRGLFLWGERVFLRSRAEVLGFLGWCAPLAMEKSGVKCPGAEGANPTFAAAIAKLEERVSAEIATYKKFEPPGAWAQHLRERKAVVSHELKTCSH
jgi:hypothetical protein